MKHLRTFLTLAGAAFVCLFFITFLWHFVIAGELEKRYFRTFPEITQAERSEKLANIHFEGGVYRSVIVALPVSLVGILLLSIIGILHIKHKQASVHTYRIGKYNEFVVHEKDLAIAAPLAMGLMNAEQIKAEQDGIWRGAERVARLHEQMAKTNLRIAEYRGVQAPALQAAEHPSAPDQVPTFQELLESGALAQGKPMILGYENGQPRYGSFLDIYSAAIAGESGSGKTATLLFLIGSGLLAQQIRFVGIDPHYPHPKSLGAKTKPLWNAGLMEMATYKDDMLKALKEVERTIDRRMKQLDTDTTPVVLVIDELAFLAKTSVGPDVAHTMERISTEGRKCAVYMLAASQTWLVSRTGPSSVVRDTLTSAYVHRIKAKQANLLLQDKEEADKVKRHVKQAGEALLCPVNDDSVIVRMPFATDEDMQTVAEMLTHPLPLPGGEISTKHTNHTNMVGRGSVPAEIISSPAPSVAPVYVPDENLDEAFEALMSGIEPAELEADTDDEMEDNDTQNMSLSERTKGLLTAGVISYGKIQKYAGIAKSTAHKFVNGNGELQPDHIDALQRYIDQAERTAAIPA